MKFLLILSFSFNFRIKKKKRRQALPIYYIFLEIISWANWIFRSMGSLPSIQ